MKGKLLLLGIVTLAIASCNDDLKFVGPTIQPEGDRPGLYADTFQLKANTFVVDSIYAKTTVGLLGQFDDPLFGELKSDYMCQFYCPDDYKFKYEPDGGVIDSINFKISYYSSLGDTLTTMHAQVFQLNRQLAKDFYTNANPGDYCDKNILLGQKTYSAYDQTVPDSIRRLDSYIPSVTIAFDKAFGQTIYEKAKNGDFKDQQSFNNYFKGIYVTTDYGLGNILYVSETSMSIYYKHTVNEKNAAGRDTSYIIKPIEKFVVTPEVVQVNQFKNSNLEQLTDPVKNEEAGRSYLKTPAGVFTKITIPLAEMAKKVDGRILNNMSFGLKVLPAKTDWEFSLTQYTPEYALLVPLDSMNSFFRNKQIENNTTSFLSSSYKDSNMYNFGNLSSLLRNAIETAKKEGKTVDEITNIEMVIVPVNRSKAQNQYTQSYYTTALSNYLAPSGVIMATDAKSLEVEIVSTKYNSSK